MGNNVYIYILIMALVTFAIRALPLTLIRKEIKSPFYKVLFILCSLCNPVGNDGTCHILCHKERILSRSRFYRGSDPCFYEKGTPDSCSGSLYSCFYSGEVPDLRRS